MPVHWSLNPILVTYPSMASRKKRLGQRKPSIYKALITGKRLRKTDNPGRNLDTEMLSDNARIVTSTAFRRLQTKAQVFSLEENAAVRTRLTHTLEVAMYGGLIAEKVYTGLLKRRSIEGDMRLPFVKAVENACLLHDVGNPPFGHLGEFAIREWFKSHREEICTFWRDAGVGEEEATTHYHAFENFDGNPQGFRFVTRLQWLNDEFGLNLTCSLLASIIKYLSSAPIEGRPFASKAGFFETERNVVSDIWKHLGLRIDKQRPGQRHPLTFLMEAADDISYCLSDIEDAIEKYVIRERDFLSILPASLRRFGVSKAVRKAKPKREKSKDANFVDFRINLTRRLVNLAAQIFLDHEKEIIEGTFTEPLLDTSTEASDALDWLKDYAKEHIFFSREAVYIELSGFQVLHGILDGFRPLLLSPPSDFAKLQPGAKRPKYGQMALEQRLFSLLPNKYRIAYSFHVREKSHPESILRAHLILDYLAGMTDSHAVKTYRMLSGIQSGMRI